MMNDAPLNNATSLPPFLSTAQVAELLGLHPATLRQWRHQRRGPAYIKLSGPRTGGPVRYARESVLAYIEARTRLARDGSCETPTTATPPKAANP